jgi:hypothetical protein
LDAEDAFETDAELFEAECEDSEETDPEDED